MRLEMSKCPPVSYRFEGSRRVLPPAEEAGREGALVYIDLGVEASDAAVIRALLKGGPVIEIFLE